MRLNIPCSTDHKERFMKNIEPGIKQQDDGQFAVERPPYKEGPFLSLTEARKALHRLRRRVQEEQQHAQDEEMDDDWPPSPSLKMC